MVDTVDAQGNPVQKYVTPQAGASYPTQPPKPPNPQLINTVNEQGSPVQSFVTPQAGDVYPSQPKAYQPTTRQGAIDFAGDKAAATAQQKPMSPQEAMAWQKYNALTNFYAGTASQQDITLLGFDSDPLLSRAAQFVANNPRSISKTPEENARQVIDLAQLMREAQGMSMAPNSNPTAQQDNQFINQLKQILGGNQ
jgi:hypothetical protein